MFRGEILLNAALESSPNENINVQKADVFQATVEN